MSYYKPRFSNYYRQHGHHHRHKRQWVGPVVVAIVIAITLACILMPATVFYAIGDFLGMWTGKGETYGNDNLIEGIDVSRYQGEIDWHQVANENVISFVYIKATEGSDMTDSRFAENFKGAREVGLRVGAYHFLPTGAACANSLRTTVATCPSQSSTCCPWSTSRRAV